MNNNTKLFTIQWYFTEAKFKFLFYALILEKNVKFLKQKLGHQYESQYLKNNISLIDLPCHKMFESRLRKRSAANEESESSCAFTD